MRFEWDASLETGDERIDRQHKDLYAIANDLRAAVAGGEAMALAPELAQELVEYATSHFADEERLMRMCGYPEHEALRHRREHADLARRARKLADAYRRGECSTALPLGTFVIEWLGGHIRRSDGHLIDFAQANGCE